MNMTIADSASVSGVVGLVACCACGGGMEDLLVSINEEEVEEEGQNAASNSDESIAVEALSYIVSVVAALLSICA